jgi:hypothetical protein
MVIDYWRLKIAKWRLVEGGWLLAEQVEDVGIWDLGFQNGRHEEPLARGDFEFQISNLKGRGLHAKARSREGERNRERGMVIDYWRLKIAKWRAG